MASSGALCLTLIGVDHRFREHLNEGWLRGATAINRWGWRREADGRQRARSLSVLADDATMST